MIMSQPVRFCFFLNSLPAARSSLLIQRHTDSLPRHQLSSQGGKLCMHVSDGTPVMWPGDWGQLQQLQEENRLYSFNYKKAARVCVRVRTLCLHTHLHASNLGRVVMMRNEDGSEGFPTCLCVSWSGSVAPNTRFHLAEVHRWPHTPPGPLYAHTARPHQSLCKEPEGGREHNRVWS